MWMSRLQMRLPRLQMRLERLLGLWRLWWLLLGTLRLVVDEANNDKIAAVHARYWHKADIQLSPDNVRFWGE
jgi:hypothetical protein